MNYRGFNIVKRNSLNYEVYDPQGISIGMFHTEIDAKARIRQKTTFLIKTDNGLQEV